MAALSAVDPVAALQAAVREALAERSHPRYYDQAGGQLGLCRHQLAALEFQLPGGGTVGSGSGGSTPGGTGGSSGGTGGTVSPTCTTPKPAANWVCVGTNWLPPNHPLAAGH